ncbi:MAG: translation initiation factor IF-2 [Candidatus Yonathbacteria bacterium]|nr:translation initiation factor IF-2 [Candidatus Yonathbacteria bacterium]NTW48033.1 translation initiation factor IF-2 [Candidatus Yonathbacteria bacterium]
MSPTPDTPKTPRSPIIVIMGHIDHGKSTLLDYIRKSNVVATESGGITQHISAYEAMHKGEDGTDKRIVFLDTPGHAAFSSMRGNGAKVADIAVLVVSAEDGVKEQTMEAHKAIIDAHIPYIVAINKIDRPGADIDRTKLSLAEHNIFVEGYGGDIPFVPISAKQGTGVSDLLDMMLLVADMAELSSDPSRPAEGVVIESNVDPRRGISASVMILDGTLEKGMFVVAGSSYSPVRAIENFAGKNISLAGPATPVRITGWSTVPPTGEICSTFTSIKEARAAAELHTNTKHTCTFTPSEGTEIVIPLIVKADTLGTLEAVEKELGKLVHETVCLRIVHADVGDIGENDITIASGSHDALVIGFRVKADKQALALADQNTVSVETFAVIYNLIDHIDEIMRARTPKKEIEEHLGSVKILKTFSKIKDKQVIGGKVIDGMIMNKLDVIIERRGTEIGRGKLTELQESRVKVEKSEKGAECGMLVEAKTDIAPGDIIIPFKKTIV